MRKTIALIAVLFLSACSNSEPGAATEASSGGTTESQSTSVSNVSTVSTDELCDADAIIADLNRLKTFQRAKQDGTSQPTELAQYASGSLSEEQIRQIIAASCDTSVGRGVSSYLATNDAQCQDDSLSKQEQAERGIVCYESPGDVTIEGVPWNEGMMGYPAQSFILISGYGCSGAAETMIQADLVPEMGVDEGEASAVLRAIHDIWCPDYPY